MSTTVALYKMLVLHAVLQDNIIIEYLDGTRGEDMAILKNFRFLEPVDGYGLALENCRINSQDSPELTNTFKTTVLKIHNLLLAGADTAVGGGSSTSRGALLGARRQARAVKARWIRESEEGNTPL
jgi:hypothetical protein